MKRITFILCLAVILAVTSNAQDLTNLTSYFEQNQLQPEKSNDGLFYQIETYGTGPYPAEEDYVMVHYVGKLLNGETFDESGNEPFVFQLGYRQVIRGWEKGIPLFQVGSKGTLFVPSSLGYGTVGAGKVIPPNAALIYEIEVLKIMDYEAYDNYMAELEERERMVFEQQQKQQFATDKKLLHEYAANHKLKTKRLPSGVSYHLKKKGKGKTPNDGNIVTIHYEGFLHDDSLFDSSYKRKQSFQFALGKGKVIKGLDEAIRFFKKGSEGHILVPSKLAYGPMKIEEDGIYIPANSVLIFKVKVLKIE